MGEGHHPHHHLDCRSHPPALRRNRRKLAPAGEMVEVQGGHIIRSTGRKDRHSKVSTARGPRDRRVRLSAHTAIQFYDVQDRLGYDRPSKAMDWLIMNARAAIDELAGLPPWHPTATIPSPSTDQGTQLPETKDSTKSAAPADELGSSCALTAHGSAGLPHPSSLQCSDAVAEAIESFFPNQQDRLSLQFIRNPDPPGSEQTPFDAVQANWQGQDAAAPPPPWRPTSLRHNRYLTQSEPLQSSGNTVSDLGMNRQLSSPPILSATGAFRSGFPAPAIIRGEDANLHGYYHMPSSASHHG